MRKVGIWIDHTKAVVGMIDEGKESLEILASNVGRHAGPSGGSGTSKPWAPHAANREHARERRYAQQLVKFYRDVIQHMDHPEQLMLIGPARAKQELKAEIEKTPLRNIPTVVEAADEMTDGQFMARLRAFELKYPKSNQRGV